MSDVGVAALEAGRCTRCDGTGRCVACDGDNDALGPGWLADERSLGNYHECPSCDASGNCSVCGGEGLIGDLADDAPPTRPIKDVLRAASGIAPYPNKPVRFG